MRFKLLLFMFFTLTATNYALAQIEVNGVVKDAQSGEPLFGATVLVKGTNNGTITDMNGLFLLSVENENAMLVISYTGYKTREIKAGKNLQVNLTINQTELD